MSNFYYDSEIELESVVNSKVTRKIKAQDEQLMIVEVFFENGGIGTAHSHEMHEQIAYCLEGEFEFILGDEVRIIKAGDSVYIPKNIIHGAVLKSENGRLLDIFNPRREDFL
jgi:quercetin dioxygenase-like cupin family protein